MTGYDPFAYGQVRLDPDQKQPPADGPDEMLFADAAPPAPDTGPDSSWSLIREDVADLAPPSAKKARPKPAAAAAPDPAADFGADLLGESVPAADEVMPSAGPTGKRRSVRRKPLSPSRPRSVAEVEPVRKPVALPGHRRMPIASAVVPLLLCVGGGTGGCWLWLAQQNPVMAGIVGVGTLVAAVFAWLFLRG